MNLKLKRILQFCEIRVDSSRVFSAERGLNHSVGGSKRSLEFHQDDAAEHDAKEFFLPENNTSVTEVRWPDGQDIDNLALGDVFKTLGLFLFYFYRTSNFHRFLCFLSRLASEKCSDRPECFLSTILSTRCSQGLRYSLRT